MGMVSFRGGTGQSMMGNLKIIIFKVKAFIHGKMEEDTKDCGRGTKCTVEEYLHGAMEKFIMENT
jgi:hypothetical protein